MKFRTIILPSGEQLDYERFPNGACAVSVSFQPDVTNPGPAFRVVADSIEDALRTLAARFKTLGIGLDNLAAVTAGDPP